jgi:DNA-binding transcriptional regulator YiaG
MLEGPVVEAAEDALAKLLAEAGRELSPKEVRFLRSILGMTQSALAERLGTDRTTVARWEIGEARLGTVQSLAVRSLVAWHLVEKNPSLASEFSERFIRSPVAEMELPYRLGGIAA